MQSLGPWRSTSCKNDIQQTPTWIAYQVLPLMWSVHHMQYKTQIHMMQIDKEMPWHADINSL